MIAARAAQPASVSVCPTCRGRGSPHMRSRQLTATVCREASSCGDGLVRAPARRMRRSLRAPTITVVARRPARLRQLALERAARVVRVARDAAPRGARRASPRRRSRGASGSSTKKTSIAGGSAVADALVLQREQQALDAGAEADAGRRRPADLLDEVVVAAAARERRVLVLERADELPGRARVVVEPADERRHEPVARRRPRRDRARTTAKRSTHSAQSESPIFGASSSAARTRVRLRLVVVEDAQRARRGLLARRLVEPLDVRRRATRAAPRGTRDGTRGSRSS